uniref:Phospholipase A2 n=1 Tax=Varanus komodoensis TaxID=61221 RepID=A0A8D2JFJ0_VARKO
MPDGSERCSLPFSKKAPAGGGGAPLRSRRGIIQLAGAVQCATGHSALAYVRYGCYCGLGGSGWPTDKVDWCCFRHDCCYTKAEEESCAPKMEGYKWECEGNEAKCGESHDVDHDCQKIICECDRELARCLAKAPYNAMYIFWPESSCGERSPRCEDD